jgi:hypothetical protein
MGQNTDEREIAMAGNLFPPLSNDSPVAIDDGTSVKRYVTPVSTIIGNGTSTYEPLSSVWEGGDGALLEEMFGFYLTVPLVPRSEA